MSALRIALLLSLAACMAKPAIAPATMATPAAPAVRLAQAIHAPTLPERGWTEVRLTLSPSYDSPAPIYVGVQIVTPPLERVDVARLENATPATDDDLRFVIFAEDGRVMSSSCDEHGAQRVRAARRRTSDAFVVKTVRRLDLCFDLRPGRYWIAGIYGPLRDSSAILYRELLVVTVAQSCTDVGVVARRCLPADVGRHAQELAALAIQGPFLRAWALTMAAP